MLSPCLAKISYRKVQKPGAVVVNMNMVLCNYLSNDSQAFPVVRPWIKNNRWLNIGSVYLSFCIQWFSASKSCRLVQPVHLSSPHCPCWRSLSPFQESAQYLAGPDAPEQLLSALLKVKTDLSKSVIGLINLSPYDCWVELGAYRWNKTHGDGIRMPSLSLSKSLQTVEYCQRSIALKLLQDKGHENLPHGGRFL